MKRLPPLNAVRAFEAAARHVSFTRAAEELHVTHGAVSRQVALLEQWLGAPLFQRSHSQLTLTEAGRSYLAEVSAALDRIATASAQLVEQLQHAALRVNAPPTFTMRWLIPRMSTFKRRRPDIEIKVTTSLAPVNFQDQSYDVAIRGAQEAPTNCRSQAFLTETIVPVCHVDLLEQGLQTPADLARHTLISYSTEPYRWADWLQAAGVPDLAPASELRFEQMYFGLQAAAEGLGLVLVPLFLVADDIIAGKLCAPFGTQAARQRRYHACWQPTASNTGVIEAFCEWLLREGRDTEQSIQTWAHGMGWPVSFPDASVT